MELLHRLILIIFASGLSLILCGILARQGYFLPDIPNWRSAHRRPVPRSGGVAMLLSLLTALLLSLLLSFGLEDGGASALLFHLLIPILGALGMGILGLLDDWKSLPASVRMLITIAIAALFLFYGFEDQVELFSLKIEGWPARLLQILWLVGCINFFNFMDGMDGLTALQAWWISISLAILFGLYSSEIGLHKNGGALITFYLLLASLLAGYIFWNFPPAKLFMGDSGSYLLGFLLSWPLLLLHNLGAEYPNAYLKAGGGRGGEGGGYPDMGVLVLLWFPLLLDASFTLLWRLRRGSNIFKAHKEHLYQLLLQRGWRPEKVLLLYFSLNLLTLPPLLLLLHCPSPLYGLLTGALIALLFGLFSLSLRYR